MIAEASLKLSDFELSTNESVTARRPFFGASAIHSIAHWVPDRVKSVSDIENEVEIFPGSMLELERRLGLREKRVCDEKTTTLSMALKAVGELEKKGTFAGTELSFNDIDLVIFFGSGGDSEGAATALSIRRELGLDGAMAFDLGNAGLGFLEAWYLVDSMILSGRIRKGLVVSAEKASLLSDAAISHINRGDDVKKHYAALTMGDGAVAAVIGSQHTRERGIHLISGLLESGSEYGDPGGGKGWGGPIAPESESMFGAPLDLFFPLADRILQPIGWEMDNIDQVIGHQVSVPASIKGAQILGLSHARFPMTFPEFGNMASVSLPLTLSVAMDTLQQWEVRNLFVLGFGPGAEIGAMVLETY